MMRRRVLSTLPLALLLLGAPVGPALADEPGEGSPEPEEPGLQHQVQSGQHRPPSAARPSTWWSRRRGPSLEVSWRTFDLAEMAGRRGRYHMFAADYFFLSRIIRAGAGLEGGFDDGPQSNFLVGTDLRFGVQYPARITPSLDLVLGLGALRLDVLHDSLVCFAYQAGLEAGVHFFVHDYLFLSFAIGWRRVGYRQPGNEQIEAAYVYNDVLSLRVGVGF